MHGITAKSLITGLILATVTGALVPFIGLYMQGSNSGAYFTSQIAHVFLLLLIILVNNLVGRLRQAWMYSRSELVVIFVLTSLANAAPGILSYWVPIVSSPFYHANAENNWANAIIPYVPEWAVPQGLTGIRAFFEGYRGEALGIPWDVWLPPVLGWLPLLVCLYLATLGLMVMLRRQWAEKERLIYPIMQLNLSMVQPDPRGRIVGPFFRSGTMWIGFAVPVIVSTVVGLRAYFPFVPEIDLFIPFPLFSSRLSFATLGFFFLIQREVAFALWLFSLLNGFQEALYTELGWGAGREAVISVWSYGPSSLVHQGMGASVVLVVGGLFVAREHIFRVFRKAFTGTAEVRDDDEILSYRGAVICLVVGLVGMFVWLVELGLPALAAGVLLFFVFVVYITLTRSVTEGGVAVIYAPLVSGDAAISAAGTAMFGPSGLVGLAFVRVFANDLLNFSMPHVANGLKLSEQIEGRRRLLFWGMLAAMMLGLAGALWMIMHLAYKYGAINLRPPNFIWLPNYVFDYAATRINTPSGPNLEGWIHTGIGGTVMALLLLARRFWTWWPLHPIGFPISSTLNWIAFSAFLAWAIKGPILRYGGVKLYRQVRPFFLGMILGQFTIYGVFWIVDAITGMVGNYLPL